MLERFLQTSIKSTALISLLAIPPLVLEAQPAQKKRDINDSIHRLIERSKQYSVTIDDHLGEGSGFDSDPLYPDSLVNCITWLQMIITSAFSDDKNERIRLMNQIRYKNGNVTWGNRLHYVDHWVRHQPAPLYEIDFEKCQPNLRTVVALDVKRFTEYHGFNGRLFAKEDKQFGINFLSQNNTLSCAESLSPGYYVMFAIASQQYNKKFGAQIGNMGRVHGAMLRVTLSANESRRELVVVHASTQFGRIVTEGLQGYVKRMQKLHIGYELYGIDRKWNPFQ